MERSDDYNTILRRGCFYACGGWNRTRVTERTRNFAKLFFFFFNSLYHFFFPGVSLDVCLFSFCLHTLLCGGVPCGDIYDELRSLFSMYHAANEERGARCGSCVTFCVAVCPSAGRGVLLFRRIDSTVLLMCTPLVGRWWWWWWRWY